MYVFRVETEGVHKIVARGGFSETVYTVIFSGTPRSRKPLPSESRSGLDAYPYV